MKSQPRDAFTLAEMLVVIAIIMILAALLVPAVYIAMLRARVGAIVIEMGQLDSAMKLYKTQYKTNYPPNFGDATKVNAHIQQIFGRRSNTTVPAALDAGEALVFWLQGYGSNPIDPLDATNGGAARVKLMQFDETRLKETRTVSGFKLYHYFPSEGQGQPYLYIHSASYGTINYAAVSPGTGNGIAYKSSLAGNPFINSDSFQIISAGLDGNYGANSTDKRYPAGTNYNPGDKDNITNFSGGTLESKQQ